MKNSNPMNSKPRHVLPPIGAFLLAFFGILHASSAAADISSQAALTGLIHTKSNPIAVVAVGGKQKIYTLGETLPGGYVISRIESDRVILTLNGRDTILYFGGTLASRSQVTPDANVKPNTAIGGATARGNVTASSDNPQNSTFATSPNAMISASWIVPGWLQKGMSGPVPMDEVKKSPWTKN
jgi:hypothetical protein